MGCHTGNYSRVGTPGKSGAFFFITKSTGYLLKSVTEEELATALEMLPNYHKHVQKNPYTLLSNFYLLFEITLKQTKYRFIVMNNVFFTPLTIHRKYDLKGSTAGRVASESERKKKSPILKDKDINQGDVKLNLTLKQNFYRRLENDIIFLQENDIMDYSLLLGIHNHEQRSSEENRMVSKFRLPQPDDTSFSGRQKNYCSSLDGKEIYFLGIIDILQRYNSRKQVEKVVKSGMQSLKAKIRNVTKEKVSVEKPFKYGQRFENFLKILCSTVSLKDFKPGTPKSYNQRKDISEEFYHILIRESPKDFKAFFFRGLFYHNPRVGDMVNAVSDYTKSIKLNPQYSNVSSYLFRSLLYLTAANSILEKRGDEIRYAKYANFAFKDLMKLIEMNQYCADAYLLRGVLWMYKFKYHLLFGKSTQEEKIGTVKESGLAQFYYKKNFAVFSGIDIASITDLYTCLGDANSKVANNFAMIRNLGSIRKIIDGVKENERVLFYPRNGKISINIRSETLVLNYRLGNDNSSISTAKSSKSIEDSENEVEKEKQEFIRSILEYVHHQDEQLYKLAERDLRKSIQINPSLHDPYGFQKMSQRLDLEYYNAYIQLAMLYLDLDRPDDAEKILSESVKKAEKKSHASYFMRGNIYACKYLALDDRPETKDKAKEYLTLAIEDYNKCLSLDPNFYKAWYNMASLHKSENPEKAEECYTKCIEISEGFYFAIHSRALLYKNVLLQKEKAIIDFTQCITLDPLNTTCHILRANTYLDMNNLQSAEMDFKQAIHVDPNCSSAYYELAKLNMNNEEKCKYYTNQFKSLTKRGGDKKVVDEIPQLLQY